MNGLDIERLIRESIVVRKQAYTPYSKYKVGAAILTKGGNIYSGCNFESVSFGASVCAERVAIGNAISNGEKEFVAICICGNTSRITPCGICRQSLAEFGDVLIICCDETGKDHIIYNLSDLLPLAFQELE